MSHAYLVRLAGSHWSVIAPDGAVVATGLTFDGAWRALNSVAGDPWPTPEEVPRVVELRREPDALARALEALAAEVV